MCRCLFTKYLTGEKWKNIVTFNQAWIYLLDWIRKRPLEKWVKINCIIPSMNFFLKKKRKKIQHAQVYIVYLFGASRNSKFLITVFQFLNIFILPSGTYKNIFPMYSYSMELRFLNTSLINNRKTYDLNL